MVDYAKKTVAELQEILKSRSLPSSGKKADLIARLTEADQTAEPTAEPPSAPEESEPAPTKQAPEPVSNPSTTDAAPQQPATQPKAEVETSAATDTDAVLAQTTAYALNLPQSDVDAEMAKRKARAERFGTGNTEAETKDSEVEKNLERAKRFGTGQTAMGKLDEALPSEIERGLKKRSRIEENSTLDDPGLRRGFRGRFGGPRNRGGGRHDNARRGDRPTGVQKAAVFSNEKDRLAAEARKKRFTAAS